MYEIKLASKDDLDSILRIEKERFVDASYDRSDYELALKEETYLVYVLKEASEVIGFIYLCKTLDECEIYHIAISKDYEGKGLAHLLVNRVFELLVNKGVKKIFLEVRSHNERAIALYDKVGFHTYQVRKNYYSNGDDALCKIKEF